METINLIRNCMVRFRKVAPKAWEQLASTSARAMRFCATCNREVFLCETDVKALEHAQAGTAHHRSEANPVLQPSEARAARLGY